MQTTRREMLKMTGAGICAATLPQITRGAGDADRPGLALQLYSVRRDCANDFDKALETVAGMGFEGVEFAGFHSYGGRAPELKERLEELGMGVAGSHVRTHLLSDQRSIDFHRAIGCRYMIVPIDNRAWHAERSKELAEELNQRAEALKEYGIYCGYHNHAQEFGESNEEGKTWWDLLAERTSDDVVLQMDVGWVVQAGRDPVKYLRRYPGRTRTVHFKPAVRRGDHGKTHIIGKDSVPWKDVVAATREVGGTEWMIVEQEHYPDGRSPMESSELSLKGLKKIL